MVVAIVIVAVILIWFIGGGIAYHASGATSAPVTTTGTRPACDDCIRLDLWWSTLDVWGKIGAAIWYGAQKFACAIRGC